MTRPRISPLAAVPSRPVKSKHALKSKIAGTYANRGANTIPGYVTANFPDADIPTKKVMTLILDKHLTEYGTVPTPIQCRKLFEGLI